MPRGWRSGPTEGVWCRRPRMKQRVRFQPRRLPNFPASALTRSVSGTTNEKAARANHGGFGINAGRWRKREQHIASVGSPCAACLLHDFIPCLTSRLAPLGVYLLTVAGADPGTVARRVITEAANQIAAWTLPPAYLALTVCPSASGIHHHDCRLAPNIIPGRHRGTCSLRASRSRLSLDRHA